MTARPLSRQTKGAAVDVEMYEKREAVWQAHGPRACVFYGTRGRPQQDGITRITIIKYSHIVTLGVPLVEASHRGAAAPRHPAKQRSRRRGPPTGRRRGGVA